MSQTVTTWTSLWTRLCVVWLWSLSLLLSVQAWTLSSHRPLLSVSPSSSALHMSLADKQAQVPLKVAIAGAGIGGAMLGYALQKKGFEVKVFEKTAKFSRFGGPIQLASNALSCVNALSPDLFDQIMNRFTFTGTRKCGIKDGIRNEWYSVFEAITNIAEENNLPYTGVIDRPDLQEILLRNMKDGTVHNSKGVDQYIQNQGKHLPEIHVLNILSHVV